MQILTQHATVGLQTKFEVKQTKMAFLASGPANPPGPARWADGYSKLPNIDAESYSVCKSDKKMAFLALGLADLPGPARGADGYSKSPSIDADSYSACYSRPTNQI